MKILAAASIAFILVTMFLSFFVLTTGMNMGGGSTDCPFMSHEEVVCGMDLAEHMSMWKAVLFSSIPPSILLLGIVVVAALIIITVAPNLLVVRERPVLIFLKWLRERVYTYTYRLLQELFSRGVLHPKLF